MVFLGEKMLKLYQWQEKDPFWPRQMLYISWCRAPVPIGKLGPPRAGGRGATGLKNKKKQCTQYYVTGWFTRI